MPSPRKRRALPAFRRVLRKHADAIDANWDGATANEDPEFLHRLRVAVRRVRATLASGKGVIARRDRRWLERGFRRLAAATGDARDVDVALSDWPARIAELDDATQARLGPLHTALLVRQEAVHQGLTGELERKHTRRFLKRWARWLANKPKRRGPRAKAPVGRIVDEQRRTLEDEMTALAAVDSVEARHALRKHAKRFRYLVDGFGAVFGDAERKELIDRLVKQQDELGRGRDAIVQAELFRSIAADAQLTDEERRAVDDLIASLPGSR